MVGINDASIVKRNLLTILFLLVFLLGKAQGKDPLRIFTDKDLYASGEPILLKLFAPSAMPAGIVSVDLISTIGKKVAVAYLDVTQHQTDGFIELPDTLSTGTYLLHASARTEETQVWKELYIVNRFTGLPESNAMSHPEGIVPLDDTNALPAGIEGIEKSYQRRQMVHAIVKLTPEMVGQTDGNLQITIAPETKEFQSETFLTHSTLKSGIEIGNDGIVISGTILDKETTQPFKGAIVMLSVPDSIPVFKYCTTGENGRFIFLLKKNYGKKLVVVQCYDPDKKKMLKIALSVNENFKETFPALGSETMTAAFRARMLKITETANYCKIFNQLLLTTLPLQVARTNKYPFYGVPSQVVFPKLFIDLPNFDEISRELLPLVKFRAYNRIPTLQVFNIQRNSFFNDQPLMLLNGIPVRDLNDIKEMGTREIDRIEIIQSERYNGNLRFAGVVAISNVKLDCARIKESDELVKLNLDAIQLPMVLNSAAEHTGKEPDLRQVLLWQPAVKPTQAIELNFRTSDIRGNFKLVIRGKSKEGTIFSCEQIFEVK
jgi:hypothetical protein